ncbi:MAG: peptide deformylase [Bacteroidales bacterium]|jgi:peptide deformylase|nr:peptide deformylase [Bacteroidales bacterium]
MILPILVYGNDVLKKKTQAVTPDYPELQTLIANMFETMYNAKGVGLAAPQIGLLVSLFTIDTTEMEEKNSNVSPVKQVFINAEIIDYTGKNCVYSEGCLSVPDIHEDVTRKSIITIHYWDEHFKEHIDTFEGVPARVIQHEYYHTLGKTFIDYLSPLKKTLLKGKLNDIFSGRKTTFYKTKSNK